MSDASRTWLTDDDLHWFNEGTHSRLYRKLGAHPGTVDGRHGTHFAVWAPNARSVSVMGDWNGWKRDATPLSPVRSSGIWHGFLPDVGAGAFYKYHVVSGARSWSVDKADPFAFRAECPPHTASQVWTLEHDWKDEEWMAARGARQALEAPCSVYEVHAGSWRHADGRPLGYRELASQLVDYVTHMGFTHVEFLPLMEHPFYGSWGYQTTGYFAPTARYGTPQDLMYLIDVLHRHGVGVILDWVPSHFPSDEHALGFFDGTHLYEHQDPRRGLHPDWNTLIFNYGRNEVRSFLLSSALFWLDRYHVDGLRVDAVASMLYLDYSRREGEWLPNEQGGRENLEAISFLKTMNEAVYREYPDVQTMAEESTAWPMVSRPTSAGGLGFGMKWDMGWMHDTLQYFQKDPVHRTHHHDVITFRMVYAFNENFVLPLSHDEVVHGKGSILGKMPGDDWQRFASLRALYGYMYAQPGKKLLFMGNELGQPSEWNHDAALDWSLQDREGHRGVQRWVTDLNACHRAEPALHELDCDPAGFVWVDGADARQSSLAWLRRGRSPEDVVLVVCNLTPVPRHGHRVGVPRPGHWQEILNGDAEIYGGSGQGNYGGVVAEPEPWHGQPHSLVLTLPPLAVSVFRGPRG